jgi:DNA-binding beta-propeller fold protein YncE
LDLFALLAFPAFGLAIMAVIVFLAINSLPIPIPTSSDVLAINFGTGNFIYVADNANGQLSVFRSNNLHEPFNSISIRSQGNADARGTPEALIELRRDDIRSSILLIFVSDTANNVIHIIDLNGTEILPSLAVGGAPRAMVITPDGRKLFVSHQQPVPQGGVMVFDISSNDPKDFHLVSKIAGVTCPEGMTLSPNGDLLYVATQCGGGNDPVLIVDTATNAVVGSIPEMAGGTSVAVNRDGSRLYVGRRSSCAIQKCDRSRILSVYV